MIKHITRHALAITILAVIVVPLLNAQPPSTPPPVPPPDWPQNWNAWLQGTEYPETRHLLCCLEYSPATIAEIAAEEAREFYNEGEEAREYYLQSATTHDWDCENFACN